MRRLLVVTIGLILLLVLVLAVAPLLLGGVVERRVDAALDRRVDARVDHGDVGLSLFRHFPNLAVTIDDLTVTGIDRFEGDTLAHADRFRLVVDLGSVVGMLRHQEPLVVRRILVRRPYLHARVEDGVASWDIMKAVDEATGGGPAGGGRSLEVDLRRLEVEDGRVVYEDRSGGIEIRAAGLEHVLSGDFSADRFALEARTAADSVTFRQGGIPYLSGARVHSEAELDADMTARRFTFRENRLLVNALGVTFDGVVALLDDGLDLDLTFAADRAGLRDLLSLVPTLYTEDFEGLAAEGIVVVDGHVRGRTGPGQVPAFALNARVEDGRFQYADLPDGFRDVAFDLAVTQPASDLDSAVVALDRLSFVLGGDPFRAAFALATPVSDPEVTFSIEGTLDLGAAAGALKLDGIDELGGKAVAEVAVHIRRSWLETEAYDRIGARGRLTAAGVAVAGPALARPLTIDTLALELSPGTASLQRLAARYGSSDVRASGRIDHLLGFLLYDHVLEGRVAIESDFLALDELRREDSELRLIPVPEDVDMALDVAIDSMTFSGLAMTEARGRVEVRDRRATLQEFSLRTLGGGLLLSGWYETPEQGSPAFDFDVAVAEVGIPGAFEALRTVQVLAPVAGYATGSFSANLELEGPLGAGLTPVLGALTGGGGIRTQGLGVRAMPLLGGLAQALRVEALREPAISDMAAAVRIENGQLRVRPFNVRLGPANVAVSGTNGVDGRLDYDLQILVPREALGLESNPLIAALRERAEGAGLGLSDIETVGLAATVGGTFDDPSVRVELTEAMTTAGADLADQVRTRIQEEAARQADAASARVEQARLQAEAEAQDRLDAARARARTRADSILAGAETQARRIRTGADSAATSIRAAADRQAERLVAESDNPIARRAAEAAGNELRREADRRATQLEDEAGRRADALLVEARTRANRVLEEAGAEPLPVRPDSASQGTADPPEPGGEPGAGG